MAWRLLAWAAGTACRFGDAAEASLHAVEHARRAGDVRQERRAATAYAAAASLGPTLVDEAIDRCESAIEQTGGDRQSEGIVLAVLGGALCDAGRVRPRALPRRARARDLRGARTRDGNGAARHGGGGHRAARRRPRGVPYGNCDPPTTRSTPSARSSSSRRSPGSSPRHSSSRGRCERGERRLRQEPRADDRGGRRDAGPLALRPRPDSRPARGATRTRRRSSARRYAYLEPTDAIDLPDRVQRRARRGPGRGGAGRGGAGGIASSASYWPRRRAAS